MLLQGTLRNLDLGARLLPQSPLKKRDSEGAVYLYNGKELQEELGLGLYDYGFRMYDLAISRFHAIDLLAENYTFQGPYAYAANNPIKFRFRSNIYSYG